MSKKLADLSFNTPIYEHIGSTAIEENHKSASIVVQEASKEMQKFAATYQDMVVDYCVEWEQIVTERVDEGLKETAKLHETLNHYQNKIEGLRAKVLSKESTTKGSPQGLTDKLARNEKKLEVAWKEHERSASTLCNLIEQVTMRGWKDLYPLVVNVIGWEIERASGEYDAFVNFPATAEALLETVGKVAVPADEEESTVAAVLPTCSSDTSGSYHSDDGMKDLETPMTPPGSRINSKISESPDHVTQLNQNDRQEV